MSYDVCCTKPDGFKAKNMFSGISADETYLNMGSEQRQEAPRDINPLLEEVNYTCMMNGVK